MPSTQHNSENYHVPQATSPEFGLVVYTNAISGLRTYAITLDVSRNHYVYPGSPESAAAMFSKMGFPVPDDLLDRYRRLYKKLPPLDPTVNMFNANEKAKADLEFVQQQQQETAIGRALDEQTPAVADTFGVEPFTLEPLPRKDETGKYL